MGNRFVWEIANSQAIFVDVAEQPKSLSSTLNCGISFPQLKLSIVEVSIVLERRPATVWNPSLSLAALWGVPWRQVVIP